ncbi:hypothetical protein RYX36_030734 [Vicia faba]
MSSITQSYAKNDDSTLLNINGEDWRKFTDKEAYFISKLRSIIVAEFWDWFGTTRLFVTSGNQDAFMDNKISYINILARFCVIANFVVLWTTSFVQVLEHRMNPKHSSQKGIWFMKGEAQIL